MGSIVNTTGLPDPEDVNTHGTWLLPVDDGKGLDGVTGLFLGMASSRRTGHNERARHYDGFTRPGPGGNCSTCRWTEIRIFLADGGGYVVHRMGRTIVPGETLRCPPLQRLRTPYEVVETLVSRVDGVGRLTRIPAMALAQCASHDVPLRDAYENRAVG